MEESWIPIDASDMAFERKDIRGILVDVAVSPYDVPEAIRGYFDNNISKFVIEFQYIGTEPSRKLPEKDGVIVVEGRNSGRLLRFEIDTPSMKANTVALRVFQLLEHAVQELTENASKRGRRAGGLTANYKLARRALENSKERIEKRLVPA